MDPLRCPICGVELQERRLDHGAAWVCPDCRGLSLNLGVLRRQIPDGRIREIWSAGMSAPTGSSRRCPSCRALLRVLALPGSPALELDLCKTCQLLWFDFSELLELGGQRENSLGPESRAAVGLAEVEVTREAFDLRQEAEAIMLFLASRIAPSPLDLLR